MIPDKKGAEEPRWRKSSYSGGESGNCVEMRQTRNQLAVRDSKNPDGTVLRFSTEAGRAFVAAATAGPFLRD
ncbi:DUF397 domain-containing protein [Lentzea chajnantorensis]